MNGRKHRKSPIPLEVRTNSSSHRGDRRVKTVPRVYYGERPPQPEGIITVSVRINLSLQINGQKTTIQSRVLYDPDPLERDNPSPCVLRDGGDTTEKS